MEAFYNNQIALAEQIKTLFIRFENKPAQRHTKGAANTQLTRLEMFMENILANHEKMIKSKAADYEHEYFTKDMRFQVEEDYFDTKGDFAEFLLDLEAAQEPDNIHHSFGFSQ